MNHQAGESGLISPLLTFILTYINWDNQNIFSMTNFADAHSDQQCQRCGTCCRKGGPTLHKSDQCLVERGAIALEDLFTIRTGEIVFNQIKGVKEPTPEEIIKIKGVDTMTWCCRYYDATQNSCRIYAHRPFECRILKCWDTIAIASTYQHERLNREDLLGKVAGLMDLINFHQTNCDYSRLYGWLKDLTSQNSSIKQQAENAITESLHWDLRIRQVAHENTKTTTEQLDFMFGRPLHKILKILGWKTHNRQQ